MALLALYGREGVRTIGQSALSMRGLSYTFPVNLTHTLLIAFTGRAICGMNVEVNGARILLSLSHLFPIWAPSLTTQTVPLSDP
jgi:hypothetical protein